MCIGLVRTSIDHWSAGYYGAVFSLKPAELSKFAPYNFVSLATPVAAILGGLVAGNVSDRVFGSRRAPVIFLAFIGMGLTLILLQQGLHSAWTRALLLGINALFISRAHSPS